jgi:hypothetical protein
VRSEKVKRGILVNQKIDSLFSQFVTKRHGSLRGYSQEVENAMMLEMARWNYNPLNELEMLKRNGVSFPVLQSLRQSVTRTVRIDKRLDLAFKSFVMLAYGRVWRAYSSAVQNGMVLLMLLYRFELLDTFWT